jgi:hypothetical protein
MARRKRSSSTIAQAQNRAVGLSNIDPKLDLGNGNTLESLQASIKSTQLLLETYNKKLGELDVAQNDLTAAELALELKSSTMLTATSAKYGKDSNEYELAGGKRKSERKSPVRKAKTTAASK